MGYAPKVVDVFWYECFKPGTVKAVERRFRNYRVSVKESGCIESMEAFEQIWNRVLTLLSLHKCLTQ